MQAEQSKGESNPSTACIKIFEISGGINLSSQSGQAGVSSLKGAAKISSYFGFHFHITTTLSCR